MAEFAGSAAALVLLTSCATSDLAPADATGPRFGWVEGQCLAVTAPLEGLPQTVWIAPATSGAAATQAQAIAPVDPDSSKAARLCNALHPDRAGGNGGGEHWFYRLDREQPAELAIASLQPLTQGHEYGVCFTTEGVRLTVAEGKRVIWEDYYFLGYDVEPSCP